MALENLKIVELGNSKVGKTTYIASMYGTLQRSFSRFKLQTVDQQEHNRLLELYGRIKMGLYPSPTSLRREHDFFLQYWNQNVLHFTWTDYRGEAIWDTSSNDDVQQLLKDLNSVDGIMVFFDANALARNDKKVNDIARRLNYLLGRAFRDLKRPISLVIVLTKVDLIGKEGFNATLLEPLRGLIEIVEFSNTVLGAIVPVACGTKMINTQMPVIFALQTRVRSIVDTLNEEYQKYKGEAETFQKTADEENQKAGGIRDFFRNLFGETTHEALAQQNYQWAKEQQEKAQAKLEEWQPLVNPVNNLNNYTKRLVRIRKGETLQSYATQLSKFEGENWIFTIVLIFIAIIMIALYLR